MSGKDEMDKVQSRLVPARPDAEAEATGFMPKLPWRLLGLGAAFIGLLAGFYLFNQHRKIEALRAQILHVHGGKLAEPVRRYGEFRGNLETLISAAASKAPMDYSEPRLALSGLHADKGLYLRLPASDASKPAGIARSVSRSPADALPACLGLAPRPARVLWDRGAFLLPAWIGEVRDQTNLTSLRVADTVLARHIEVDLPAIVELMRSKWFLLALEQQAAPGAGPATDVFLWDLGDNRTLFRGRFQGEGILLPVRVRSKDAPPTAKPPPPQPGQSQVAQDCSIAAQIKQRLAQAPAQP
jgi:hypothetical protein